MTVTIEADMLALMLIALVILLWVVGFCGFVMGKEVSDHAHSTQGQNARR